MIPLKANVLGNEAFSGWKKCECGLTLEYFCEMRQNVGWAFVDAIIFCYSREVKSCFCTLFRGGGGRVTFNCPNIADYLIVRFEFQKYSTLSLNQGTTDNRNEVQYNTQSQQFNSPFSFQQVKTEGYCWRRLPGLHQQILSKFLEFPRVQLQCYRWHCGWNRGWKHVWIGNSLDVQTTIKVLEYPGAQLQCCHSCWNCGWNHGWDGNSQTSTSAKTRAWICEQEQLFACNRWRLLWLFIITI